MSNLINHITIILDRSGSMDIHENTVVAVTDQQVALLAENSTLLNQETRITMAMFASPPYMDGKILDVPVYDTDVLRAPSLKGLYKPHGGTALCEAVLATIDHLKAIPETFGDHSHLVMLITDSRENASSGDARQRMPGVMKKLPDNWTFAAFVPSASAKWNLQSLGIPVGNIEIWDATSKQGVEDIGVAMAAAIPAYMESRAGGMRSTDALFSLGSMAAPKAEQVKAQLTPLTRGSYFFLDVSVDEYPAGVRIDEFVTAKTGLPYNPGMALYQMMKRERIQDHKKVAVELLSDQSVYMGPAARQMLGLPERGEVRVSPGSFKGYAVFIQSTSMNRKLLGGTRLLVMR